MKLFFETIKLKNETLFYFGWLCLIASTGCLILIKYSSIQILGISGWIKPFKFCISTTIMAWTMAYYMKFLDNQFQVSIYSWSFVVLLSIEILLIIYQASRGKISHFNQENASGTAIFSIMSFTITIFMLHTAYITFLFLQQESFAASPVLIMAIKLSLVVTILYAFEGFAMGAILKHTIGAADGGEGLPIVNWSKNNGDLRVAHFFGMHALQFIPIISILLAKTKTEVFLITSLYFLFVTFTLIQAILGKPFF